MKPDERRGRRRMDRRARVYPEVAAEYAAGGHTHASLAAKYGKSKTWAATAIRRAVAENPEILPPERAAQIRRANKAGGVTPGKPKNMTPEGRQRIGEAARARASRPVLTPTGRFDSATRAAEHHRITVGAASRRAKFQRQGWRYEDAVSRGDVHA